MNGFHNKKACLFMYSVSNFDSELFIKPSTYEQFILVSALTKSTRIKQFSNQPSFLLLQLLIQSVKSEHQVNMRTTDVEDCFLFLFE